MRLSAINHVSSYHVNRYCYYSQARSRSQSQISREGLTRLLQSLALLRRHPGPTVIAWARQQERRLISAPPGTKAASKAGKRLPLSPLTGSQPEELHALARLIDLVDSMALRRSQKQSDDGPCERSILDSDDAESSALESGSVPHAGRINNVLDAGPLLRRLQGQLRAGRKGRGPEGVESQPSVGPDSPSSHSVPAELMIPIGNFAGLPLEGLSQGQTGELIGSRSVLESGSGSPQAGEPLVQVLGFKLLSAKFGKIVAFAVSVHVMRSAYQVHLRKAASTASGVLSR